MSASLAGYHEYVTPHPQTVRCPIQSSLGVFGRKWALLVLRDVALKTNTRFSDILRSNPGMTPRVLVFRLRDLEAEGLIRRRTKDDKREVHYELTPAGRDTIPILTALIYFGSKRRAHEVFRDRRPRSMMEMFPSSQRQLLQGMSEWAARAPASPRRTRVRRGDSTRDGVAGRPGRTVGGTPVPRGRPRTALPRRS